MKLSDLQDAVNRAKAVGRQWPVYVNVDDAQKLLDIAEAAMQVYTTATCNVRMGADDKSHWDGSFRYDGTVARSLREALEGVEP